MQNGETQTQTQTQKQKRKQNETVMLGTFEVHKARAFPLEWFGPAAEVTHRVGYFMWV